MSNNKTSLRNGCPHSALHVHFWKHRAECGRPLHIKNKNVYLTQPASQKASV